MKRTHWLWFGLMLGVGLLGWWGRLPSARAGVITVCPAGCDYATIQGAVNAAAPLSTIQIFSATYTETVIITKSLTLDGVGQPQPVVSGNDVGRPFTILGSVAVTMTNLMVTRGRAPLDNSGSALGGGIFNQGQLTLDHMSVSYNQAIGANGDPFSLDGHSAYGGGIYTDCGDFICGVVTLKHTTVISNTAVGGDGEDGIYPAPFGGQGGEGSGGGIYVTCFSSVLYMCGSLISQDSVIAHNKAQGGVGGDKGSSYFPGSGGTAMGGGAIYKCDAPDCHMLYVLRTDVHHNLAQAGDGGDTPHVFGGTEPTHSYGGGIYATGYSTILASNIHHNVVHSGAYVPIHPYSWNMSAGGGLFSRAIYSIMEHSTVWQNEADLGGGIAVFEQDLKVRGSTISQNVARECGGGALLQSNYDLRLDYVTITENVALGYANPRRCGDEYEEGAGSGVYIHPQLSGVLNMKSSILARNLEPNHVGGDCYKNVYSRGFNLIEKTNHCVITGIPNGNLFHLDPLLGPLQGNGGLTPTYALLAGSVAIDAAAPTDCPNTDQRQYPRWVDGNGDGIERCDMGAYEYGGAPTDVGMVNEVRGRGAFSFPFLILALLGLLALCYLRATQHAPRHDATA